MDNVSVLESSITFFITIISNCVTGHRNIILDLLLQFTNNTFLCVTKKKKNHPVQYLALSNKLQQLF